MTVRDAILRSLGVRPGPMVHAPACCEALEPRALLMSPTSELPFVAFFPEGFASPTINEFVPVTNPNAFPVTVELHARYEFGEVGVLVGRQTIPAQARGGFTVSDAGNPAGNVVRSNVPYALIIRASAAVSATFSHYDFGTAVGEAFATSTSTTWTFADGLKDATLSRDFILVYNPSFSEAVVTLTLYGQEGVTATSIIRVGSERRGGWSIQDIPDQPPGLFGARITSTVGIVASQTHYELQSGRGYAVLGDPNGGNRAGMVPAVGFDDGFYDRNGSDPGAPRFQADAFISILNTSPAPGTVRMNFIFDDTGRGTVTDTIVVPANSVRVISVRDLGFVSGDQFGLAYEANAFVTLNVTTYQGQDATGVTAVRNAATVWDFGEGYMSRNRAGAAVIENVHIFNPNAGPVDITLDFLYPDGSTVRVIDILGGGELATARIHDIASVRDRAPDSWFGLRLTAFQPVVAMMEHWDAGNGGGFATFGMPGGTLRNLQLYDLVP